MIALVLSEGHGFVSVLSWGRKVALGSLWGYIGAMASQGDHIGATGVIMRSFFRVLLGPSWNHISVAASSAVAAAGFAVVPGDADAAGAACAARGA